MLTPGCRSGSIYESEKWPAQTISSESRGGGGITYSDVICGYGFGMTFLHNLANANCCVHACTDKCIICGLHDFVAIGPISEGRRNVDISQ